MGRERGLSKRTEHRSRCAVAQATKEGSVKTLERSIENAVVGFAKKMGIEVVKLNGMGKRSHPDRMFLGPRGRLVFIEFKREGEKPTPLQLHLHKLWKRLGHRVYVVDNKDDGKMLIRLLLGKARLDLEHPL